MRLGVQGNGEGLHAVKETGSSFYTGNAGPVRPPHWAFLVLFLFFNLVLVLVFLFQRNQKSTFNVSSFHFKI